MSKPAQNGLTNTKAGPGSEAPRLLVLGATGKLGRMLRAWWARFSPPFVPVWQARGPRPGHVVWSPGASPEALGRADVVLALWGVTRGTSEALAANAELARAAHDVAQAVGARRLLVASSAAVYGPGEGLREATPTRPVTPYGIAKLDAERTLDALARSETTPRICRVRLANVVGADSLFASLAEGRALVLDRFADGQGPLRSYLAPGDLAAAIEVLATCDARELPAVVNVAGDRPLVMEALARAWGAEPTWRPAPPDAVARVTLDTRRLGALMGPLRASSSAQDAVAQLRQLDARAGGAP